MLKVDYPEPDLLCDLSHVDGNGNYDQIDQFGRVVDLLWRDYGSSTDAARIKHGYDRASNRLWREDTVSKAQGTPVYVDEFYTYNNVNELTNRDRGELTGTPPGETTGTFYFNS